VAVPGMLGLNRADIEAAGCVLAERAAQTGQPLADYLISPELPGGVFIVAEHDDCQRDALRYLKLGSGPYYVLVRNYHLCHLEIPSTILRVMSGGGILLNNSIEPTVAVIAITANEIHSDSVIPRAIGSRDVRGIAVQMGDAHGHIPIGLLDGARIKRRLEPGVPIMEDDVELADTLASRIWKQSIDRPQEAAERVSVSRHSSRAA